jgi:Asp-tRNA(Asn)/Glu-tRNA(Gln) amidotransferase B subunit
MQSGQAIREAITLEREKEMEFNTIMQALIKDIAEQLRPTVADMVKQQMEANAGTNTNLVGDWAWATIAENISESQLAYLAEHLSDTQLVTVAENVSASDIASELSSSQLSDIASDIDLGDLAGEFDADKIMENYDLDDAMRNFFSNNTFSIRA